MNKKGQFPALPLILSLVTRLLILIFTMKSGSYIVYAIFFLLFLLLLIDKIEKTEKEFGCYPFLLMPKMDNFLQENNQGGPNLTILNVVNVLNLP